MLDQNPGPANLSQQVLLKPQKRKHKIIKCAIPSCYNYPEPVLIAIHLSLVGNQLLLSTILCASFQP